MRLRVNCWLLLLTALLLMAHPGRAQKSTKTKATAAKRAAKAPADAEKWVRATMKKMTLEEKLGQLLMVFYFGGYTSTESAQYKDLVAQIERNHVGGLVLQTRGTPLGVERSQVYPSAVLANQLQGKAKLPLLVAADFERGTAMRLEEGTPFPHAMAVGATFNAQDAYTMGKITALEARTMGVHWIFAPVADVNSNPENPIINTRSFGEDPQRVAEYTAAFVRGVEDNGALSTTKHFPGHGDTSTDSHIDLPTVKGDKARLESVELLPFREAIASGTSTIMTGHLAVPVYEANPDVPATLSHGVLTDLLRKQLHFEGIIVTDALDMGGVTVRYAPADVAVRAIEAGADVLLVPPIVDAAITGMKEAVASGRIPMTRIDESVERILRAKARLGLHKRRLVDLDALNAAFRRPEFVAQAQDIADRGVTLLRDEPKTVPLDATRPRRMFLLAVSADLDAYPGEELERELRWRVDRLDVLRADTRFVKVETLKLPPVENYDVAVVALFVRVADRKGTVSVPEEQAKLVNEMLLRNKPTVVLAFGSPYLIERFPDAKTWLGEFSTVDIAQRAAARALFGQTAISGKLPVTIPGVAKLGDGLTTTADAMKLRESPALAARLATAYEVMDRAVADGAFPGGALAVGHRGELAVRAFGRQTYDAKSPAVDAATIYDAASLSKAVATTTAAEMLIASGRLGLDMTITRFLPEFAKGPQPEWRGKVTVKHLLLHNSGLPGYRNYFEDAKSKRDVLARIFIEPLEAEPGTKTEYSDLDFILLGEIIERLSGKPLDAFARERIFAPLKMKDSLYNPPKALRARIVPTEDDKTFRKRLVQGEVHDENAFAMGGVAGHAGLFSTGADLAAFCQMLLNGGIYGHERVLSRRMIVDFTKRQNGDPARALGWDVPSEPSSSGRYFSARSFGHLGYTGTSIWIDPDKELFVILLTNRVYPTRENEKIQQVRPAVHDAIVEALGLAGEGAVPR